MQRIGETIDKVMIGEPIMHRNPAVFPLSGSYAAAADYVTLDEALAQKCAAGDE
jgi:hypothetical protein